LFGKACAAARAVPVAEFEDGGTADVVAHGRRHGIGWLPRANSPAEVAERAERLYWLSDIPAATT